MSNAAAGGNVRCRFQTAERLLATRVAAGRQVLYKRLFFGTRRRPRKNVFLCEEEFPWQVSQTNRFHER